MRRRLPCKREGDQAAISVVLSLPSSGSSIWGLRSGVRHVRGAERKQLWLESRSWKGVWLRKVGRARLHKARRSRKGIKIFFKVEREGIHFFSKNFEPWEFHIYLRYKPFVGHVICQYFLSECKLSFYPVNGVFCGGKVLKFYKVQFTNFSSYERFVLCKMESFYNFIFYI